MSLSACSRSISKFLTSYNFLFTMKLSYSQVLAELGHVFLFSNFALLQNKKSGKTRKKDDKESLYKAGAEKRAFVPQTHVAACGDSGTVYKFTCDAPRGTLYYFRDKPASGSQPTIGNRGIWLGNYHPCSAFHEAEANLVFIGDMLITTIIRYLRKVN